MVKRCIFSIPWKLCSDEARHTFVWWKFHNLGAATADILSQAPTPKLLKEMELLNCFFTFNLDLDHMTVQIEDCPLEDEHTSYFSSVLIQSDIKILNLQPTFGLCSYSLGLVIIVILCAPNHTMQLIMCFTCVFLKLVEHDCTNSSPNQRKHIEMTPGPWFFILWPISIDQLKT